MILTEEEAKTKWCPFTRVLAVQTKADRTLRGNVEMVAAACNRGGPMDNCLCLGSGCMVWKIAPLAFGRGRGSCGLATSL